MEPKGSLPHSQLPTTCPYPEQVKWLHFLNGILYCYNTYTNLNPIHYHLVSDSNTCPNILHILMQPGREIDQHLSVRSQERQWQSICNLLFGLSSVLGFRSANSSVAQPHKIRSLQGQFCWTLYSFYISLHKICASYSVTYSDGSLLHYAVQQIWRKTMTVPHNLPKMFKVKVKPLCTPWQYIGGVELILNRGVRWRWMVNFQLWQLYFLVYIEKEAGCAP